MYSQSLSCWGDAYGGGGGTVDSAFGLLEAAPTAGARILSRLDDRRAGCAADRTVTLGDQRMRRQPVGGDVVRDIGGGPARQGVHFHVGAVEIPRRPPAAARIGRAHG